MYSWQHVMQEPSWLVINLRNIEATSSRHIKALTTNKLKFMLSWDFNCSTLRFYVLGYIYEIALFGIKL